jgi:hypothetical protein
VIFTYQDTKILRYVWLPILKSFTPAITHVCMYVCMYLFYPPQFCTNVKSKPERIIQLLCWNLLPGNVLIQHGWLIFKNMTLLSKYFLRNEQKLTTLGIFDLHLGVYFLLRCDYIECFFLVHGHLSWLVSSKRLPSITEKTECKIAYCHSSAKYLNSIHNLCTYIHT